LELPLLSSLPLPLGLRQK
jgi:peptidyl-tRNA hydrolase ICT1